MCQIIYSKKKRNILIWGKQQFVSLKDIVKAILQISKVLKYSTQYYIKLNDIPSNVPIVIQIKKKICTLSWCCETCMKYNILVKYLN